MRRLLNVIMDEDLDFKKTILARSDYHCSLPEDCGWKISCQRLEILLVEERLYSLTECINEQRTDDVSMKFCNDVVEELIEWQAYYLMQKKFENELAIRDPKVATQRKSLYLRDKEAAWRKRYFQKLQPLFYGYDEIEYVLWYC